MNIQQLRQSLKVLWLNYYREHRDWLIRIGVWVTCEGKRRPSSSFILATLSILEPELTKLLPLIVDLSSNPDRIVTALGLNFNPDEELEAIEKENQTSNNGQVRMLPGRPSEVVDVRAKNVPVKHVVLEASQPVAVDAPRRTTKPRPTQPANPTPIDSPFGNLPEPLVEPAEASEAEDKPAANPVSNLPNPESGSSRPVMDTVELSAGELPQREVSAVDETCEGVRGRSAVRNRKDSR